MWRFKFQERRCLIPASAFAEAEGPNGQMTRTWFSLPDQLVFAVAGIRRDTDEWGRAYSMVMTECGNVCSEVHSRMPVILHPADCQRWTDGEPDEARALCVPYSGAMTLDSTTELWRRS
jgi:putative SOS response-associated peptidase YedK